MNASNLVYNHIDFNNGAGNWRDGNISTSHIESVWSFMKKSILNQYFCILYRGLYVFLKEAEFQFIMKNRSDIFILNLLKKNII